MGCFVSSLKCCGCPDILNSTLGPISGLSVFLSLFYLLTVCMLLDFGYSVHRLLLIH